MRRLALTTRSVDIGELLEIFLVFAIGTVLVIRLELYLTNYPQLGGSKLHIAHVLPGGLLMMIAIAIMLAYVPRTIRIVAAVLGGIGFGFFIDELGKFITKDVNYFYKPTAALIYIVFILMFLAFRTIQRRRGFSEREYLINAVELLKDAAIHDLDADEERRIYELLSKADQSDPLVPALRRLLDEVQSQPTRPPGLLARTARRIRTLYFDVVEEAWFKAAIIGVWVVFALASLGQSIALVAVTDPGRISYISWAILASSFASCVLVAIGIFHLRRRHSRRVAYRWFDRAILIAIFVTQVFAFARDQFTAVYFLFFYVVVWATLRYGMDAEAHVTRAKAASA